MCCPTIQPNRITAYSSVDLGVAFTYTGCGGRDLKGTKQNPKNLRTAMQTFDQSFDWPFNASLKVCPEFYCKMKRLRAVLSEACSVEH